MKKGYVVLNCSGFCGVDRCSICTYSVVSCLARFSRAPSRCFQSEVSTMGAAASGLSASLCVLQEVGHTPQGFCVRAYSHCRLKSRWSSGFIIQLCFSQARDPELSL